MSPPPASIRSDRIIVGRSDEARWRIARNEVSGKHLQLTVSENEIQVQDLGSKNGTFLNGERLNPGAAAVLRPGDVLTLATKYEVSHAEVVRNLASLHQKTPIDHVQTVTVGSSKECDVIINDKLVSRRHAELIRVAGNWCARDAGSSGGTYLSGVKVVGPELMTPDAPLEIGSVRLWLADLNDNPIGRPNRKVLVTPIAVQVYTIGRSEDCDLSLPGAAVSRNHASISYYQGRIFIADANSKNGTYVNDYQVKGQVELQPGDVITIGPYVLRRGQANVLIREIETEERVLLVNHASFMVDAAGDEGKLLLDDVCFAACRNELLAIMGQSGSGKTTLLKLIVGINQASAGNVLLLSPGSELEAGSESGNANLGYVPCEEIVHTELTVYEALYYACRMRRPEWSEERTRTEIREILTQLQMIDGNADLDLSDQVIGDAEKGGLSSGQKKRLQIAMELIFKPDILLLDEPTSGLSSEDAVVVMDILKAVASEGRCVMCTLHQPNLEIFCKLDKVAVIHKGRLMYCGPAHPDSIQFFNPDISDRCIENNPDNALSGMIRNEAAGVDFVEKFKSSRHYHAVCDEGGQEDRAVERAQEAAGWPTQFLALLRRNLIIKHRDKVNSAMLLLQSPIIALLISSVFYFSSPPHLIPYYLMVIASIWFGTTNAIREIVAERTILRYEKFNGLKVSAYVLAKFCLLTALCAFQCLCMVVIVAQLLGLACSLAALWGVLFLSSLTGLGIGLLISALTQNQQRAMTIIPLTLIPMVILGGGMIYVSKMDSWSVTAASIMPSRWAYELIIHQEDDCDAKSEKPAVAGAPKPPDLTETMYADRKVDNAVITTVLSGMILVFLGGVVAALRATRI